MTDLEINLKSVNERILATCKRTGRNVEDIALIAVSKTIESDLIGAANRIGIEDFGENRPVELAEKAQTLPASIHWHMIGHLQSNKIKRIIPYVHRIHSIDSSSLLASVDAAAGQAERTIPVLLEVNVSRETQKHGFMSEDIPKILESSAQFTNLTIDGFMTVAEHTSNTEALHQHFAALRELRSLHGNPHWHLSMGMSHDFEIAIEEGATMIRIGSALFGARS